MLAIHLFNHEGLPDAADESRVDHLGQHLRWTPGFSARVVELAERHGLIRAHDGQLALTDQGRARAKAAMVST